MKSIENIVMVVLAIVIAVSLVPVVANTVAGGQKGNVTGASSVLLGLVTLVFIVGIIVIAVKKMIGNK
jgi:xanthine/uracil permease